MTCRHIGGSQTYDPFLGTLNTRCRIIIGIQKRDHNFDDHPYHIPLPGALNLEDAFDTEKSCMTLIML